MKDNNLQLNELFEEWIKRSEENGERRVNNEVLFTKDGIVYKNDISIRQTDQDWETSDKRIMFIVKDNPADWSDDVRLWLRDTVDDEAKHRKVKENNRKIAPQLIHRIANLFWGLTKAKADAENLWWYGEVEQHKDDVREFFNTHPFALVESKKQPGGPKIDDKTLSAYLSKYGDLLMREIDILNPNVIVCMGGPIYDFILKEYSQRFGTLKKYHNNIHAIEDGTLIIYAGHPSNPYCSDENYYEGVMWWYRKCYQKSVD